MKVVVIGGGAAGMMFSTQYKKANPSHDVSVFEKTEFVAWAGCPTPYYIAKELPRESVVLGTADEFIAKGIDVNINHNVKEINVNEKYINVEGNKISGKVFYDKLILCLGAKSFIPTIEGYDSKLENIFTLSHAKHAFEIEKYIDSKKPKNALIVGAGFIGIEMAEAFEKRGMNVTIVEKASTIFPSISENLKKDIYDEIKSHNIDLKLNSGLKEILDNGTKAIMENGDKIPFDIALLSIGITANTDIVSNTKIETKKGKIVINDKFETNIKDVYAIGDCVLSKFYNTSDDLYAPFGDVANKHGMLLAKHLSGQEISWKGLLRSFASSIYEVKLAQTGLSLEEAMNKGYDADIIEMKALYRNSAFDGKRPNKMEVVYDKKTKKILGAACVGSEAVAQFIDQIAIVITCDIPVEKFIEIDFAYSPTNSSVWNPLLVIYRKLVK